MTNRSLPLFTITLASALASRTAGAQSTSSPTFVPSNPYDDAIKSYELPGSSGAPRAPGAMRATTATTPSNVTTITTGSGSTPTTSAPTFTSTAREGIAPNPYAGPRAATNSSMAPAASANSAPTASRVAPSSSAPPEFVSYHAARGPAPLPLRCTPPVILPIRSQLGRDGNWHIARAPEAPPQRSVGGGPVDPSCVIHSPSEDLEASASSSPPSASEVATTAPSAPPAAVDVASSAAPEGTATSATVVETGAQTELASSLRRARGGGPVPEELDYTATMLRPRPRPRIARFMLGFGGGTGMYTTETDGRDLGPSWYAGLGLEVARVVTIEGRYQGGHNNVPAGLDANGNYGVLFNGATGLVRLALPTPYVSPYVHSGIGYLWFTPTGSAQGQQTVVPNGLTNVPVGGGIEFRFTRGVGLDLEYTYQFLLDSRWTVDHASHPWGDLWNASAALRFYL